MYDEYETMKFNEESQYWHAYDGRQCNRQLTHGDGLWIQIGGKDYYTWIKWDEEWFITLGEIKFWLHRKTQYQVILLLF